MNTPRALILAALATAAAGPVLADVRVPALFSDHLVLQSGRPVPVWGMATAGEKITVTFAGQSKIAQAGPDGKWSVKLDALAAAKPAALTVAGHNTITIDDVLVGDVWLCSGQSNMALPVSKAQDFERERTEAKFPSIRLFRDISGSSPSPRPDAAGKWIVCSPDTVGDFSAAAYFFGREIHQKLDLPIGLIDSSVGDTPIEAWTSLDAQKDIPELQPIFAPWTKAQSEWNPEKAKADYEQQLAAWKLSADKAKTDGKTPPTPPRKPADPAMGSQHPGNLFNGKIAPLASFPIRGAIWYQGEANSYTENAGLYGRQLSIMITDWRNRWGYDFPFITVQLPDFTKPQTAPVENSGRAAVREGVLQSLRLPNVGMAVTLGTGEVASNHPRNKQEAGRRLALWALAEVYKQKDIVASGPLYTASRVAEGKVILTFTHTDGGLVAKGGPLKGFAIAGRDQKWLWADAKIEGDTVVVSSANITEPAAVRYAWATNPASANLYNQAGLPASPFRTDDFPLKLGKIASTDPQE